MRTSDLHNAGTHAQVWLTVYGQQGVSQPQPLGTAGPTVEDMDRGKESTFTVSLGL